MDKVAVILNPAAGRQQLVQSIDTIVGKLQEEFREVTVYRTEEPGDGAAYVRELAADIDLLVAAGGDGTVHEIANALCKLKNRPVFAILPGGTSNDFSRAIGINQNPLRATEQLLQQKIKAIDVGQTDEQYFLNFWGVGLITQVSSRVDPGTKNVFGRLSYYTSAAQNLADIRPFRLKLESDECKFDEEAVMAVVGNGPFTGGVRAFFPKSDITDGLLDVLIIKETSLQTLWSVIRPKGNGDYSEKEEGVVYFQTGRLEISTDPEQQIDCDGERNHHTPSTISVLPGYLKMIIAN